MTSIEKSLLLNVTTGLSIGAEWRGLQTPAFPAEECPDTLVLNGLHLAQIRHLFANEDTSVVEAVTALSEQAELLLHEGPWSVTDKAEVPDGFDSHHYLSLAKYWWPDPKAPEGLPYTRKDGEVNPDCYSEKYDSLRLVRFSESLLTLTLSGYLSGKAAHTARAASLVDVWFLHPDTRQYPSFQHAQNVPGQHTPRGPGTIEARHYIYIAECIHLLRFEKALPKEASQRLTQWYGDFLTWMRESEMGVRAHAAQNNIGLWYDFQCLAYAWFIGDKSFAEEILVNRAFNRFEQQTAPDGGLPAELAREKPFEYVSFTLTALAGLASAGEKMGIPIWDAKTGDGRGFGAATDWFQALPIAREFQLGLSRGSHPIGSTPDPDELARDSALQIALLTRVAEARRLFAARQHAALADHAELGKTLAAAETRLAETERRLQIQQEEVAAKKDSIVSLQHDLIERDQVIHQSTERLHSLESQLAAVQTRLKHEEAKTTKLRESLKKTTAEKDKHRARVEDRDEKLAARNRRIRQLENKIIALRGSLSYQVTKPLRAVIRLLDKGKPKRTASSSVRPARESPRVTVTTPSPPRPVAPSEPLGGPDTFVLYRIIGNDLYPRHKKGQTRENLAFILEHEPELADCEKRFIVNRIFDPEEERAIIDLLENARQPYLRIPFDLEEYGRIQMDYDLFPEKDFFLSKTYDSLGPEQKMRAEVQARRHKNNYAMNNNGARNAALLDGRNRAKWILPWDGNCFLNRTLWTDIRQGVKEHAAQKYLIVPMARVTANESLLDPDFRPEASEEPQVVFRKDAAERFDEAYPYGRRPKVELFWRLGVPGAWDKWKPDPWDLSKNSASPEAGQFGYAGCVARLNSGQKDLEQSSSKSFKQRGLARAEAIRATLDYLDAEGIRRRLSPKNLLAYEERRLRQVKDAIEDPDHPAHSLAHELLRQADEAAGRGPFSVTHKTTLPPSGDPHDYWHPAPYWWPDPNSSDGLPYIRKDGERVPGTQLYEEGSEKYDRTRLQRLFDDSLSLALAWHVSGRETYAKHAASLFRVWFLDPATRMNPHLKFSQVRMGRQNNEGTNTGLIETKDFYYYLDAVRILHNGGFIRNDELTSFQGWLREFRQWLIDSPQGKKECLMPNNHGTLYDLQLAAISAFLGDADHLAEIFRRSRARIPQQFAPDGKQPNEMTRTQTAHYCAFNLQSWVNLGNLAERCGDSLWSYTTANGRNLRTGLAWLTSFWEEREWPYEQIEPFDWDRLVPLALTQTERFAEPRAANLPGLWETPSSFFAHDGIQPFWALAHPHFNEPPAAPAPHEAPSRRSEIPSKTKPLPLTAYRRDKERLHAFARRHQLNLAHLKGTVVEDGPQKMLPFRDPYEWLIHPALSDPNKDQGDSTHITALHVTQPRRFANSLMQLSNGIMFARQNGIGRILLNDFWYLPKDEIRLDDSLSLVNANDEQPVMVDGPLLSGEFFYRSSTLHSLYPKKFRHYKNLQPLLEYLTIKPSGRAFKENELVVHLRAGDVFREKRVNFNYGQPPLAFYLAILKQRTWSRVHLVYEDRSNPVIPHLEDHLASRGIPLVVQSGTLNEDIEYLLRAKSLVAGRGTFMSGLAAISPNVKTVYYFEKMYKHWGGGGKRIQFVDREGTYQKSIGGSNWKNEPWQRQMMVDYPEEALQIVS